MEGAIVDFPDKKKNGFQNPRRNRRVLGMPGPAAALVLLSVSFLYWVFLRTIPLSRVMDALTQWTLADLLNLAAVNLLVLGAMTIRWGWILDGLGIRIPFRRLVCYRTAANAVSTATPGPQFGGEPLQVYLLSRYHGVVVVKAAASVAMDRLIELAASFCLLMVAGVCLVRLHVVMPVTMVQVLAVKALLLLLFWRYWIALGVGRTPLADAAGRIRTWFPASQRLVAATAFLASAEQVAGEIVRQPFRVRCAYLTSALFHWLVTLCEFWLIYHVLGVDWGPLELLVVAGAARLSLLAPVPAGLGVLEAGQLLVLSRLGADPALGLAACCIMRVRDLVLVTAGTGIAAFWLTPTGRVPKTRSAGTS